MDIRLSARLVRRKFLLILTVASLALAAPSIIAQEPPNDSYGAIGVETVLDRQWVGAREFEYPRYSERVSSIAFSLKSRSYFSGGAWGPAFSVSFLVPRNRKLDLEGVSFRASRAAHETWYGGQLFGGGSYRYHIGETDNGRSPVFVHLDAGPLVTYYHRSAKEAQGNDTFRSRRLGLAIAVRPGLLIQLTDHLHLGFETLAGFSLVSSERVSRSGYRNISYTESFNGYVVVPAISVGLNSTGFRQ